MNRDGMNDAHANDDGPGAPWTRLTRRGFLAGTIAAALAACSDDDASPDTSGEPATTTTPPSPATDAPTTTAAASTTSEATTTAAPAPETTASSTVPVVASDPFTLGVASGDPLADSVILWTRLLPTDALPDEDIEVTWEIASDEGFTDIVATGTAPAVAALGHSVHADATGLEPDTEYRYRFVLGEYATPAARTRTFAAPGTMTHNTETRGLGRPRVFLPGRRARASSSREW